MEQIMPDGTRRRWPRCIVCVLFNMQPIGFSVNQTDEVVTAADGLCRLHRAPMTEGYCVICVRRRPWATIYKEGRTGVCKGCFSMQYGKKFARSLERGRRNGWPEGLWYLKDAA